LLWPTPPRPFSPEGGSTALGAWGYVCAVAELAEDLKRIDGGEVKPTTVICAAGSGGTVAGLALGARMCDFPIAEQFVGLI
jgi:D-cysteine desulfhydrase